ncbi:PAS domain S-box protein [Sansalvadorimonas verongulae]|uniref:PAS domain S-box protein n=1 Tax=Sansalvadorimonas verongulae TaxID=2172824 RepID=UPI0012BD6E8A|nr:PAS domain S-box protein [Sansalvadorimonas verongulae]MTI14706.1 PAS domain S-box protein [Sansalvadorimonas verongulae]
MTFSIRQKIIFFTVIPVTLVYNIIFILSLNQNVASETRYIETQLVDSVAAKADRINAIFQNAILLSDMAKVLLTTAPESLPYNSSWKERLLPLKTVLHDVSHYPQVAIIRKQEGDGARVDYVPEEAFPSLNRAWVGSWRREGKLMGWSVLMDSHNKPMGFVYSQLFSIDMAGEPDADGVILTYLPVSAIRDTWDVPSSINPRRMLITREGQIVYYSPNSFQPGNAQTEEEMRSEMTEALRLFVPGGTPMTSYFHNGEERLIFHKEVPVTGWYLTGVVNKSDLMAEVRSSIWVQAAMMIVSLGGLLFCSWFLAGRIVRPLRQLDQAISRVSDGHLDTEIDISSEDESGRLARRFSAMLQQLQLREKLEHEARTTAFDHIVQGMTGDFFYFRHDLDGNVTFASPSIEHILGVSVEDFYGHFTKYYTSSPQNEIGLASTGKVIHGESSGIYEVEMHDGQGRVHFVEIVKVPAYDFEGKICGIEGMGRDVTKRVSDVARFRGLLESAPDAMVITDVDGLITMVNVRTELLLGFQRASLIGRPVAELFPDSEGVRFPLIHATPEQRKTLRIRSGLELQARKRNGRTIPVEITLNPIETPEGVQISIFMRDVSDRYMAEQALRASEERYRHMIEALQQEYIFYSQRVDGSFVYVTDSVEWILGYTPLEFTDNWYSYLASDDDRARANRVHRMVREGQTHSSYELEVVRADGSISVIEVLDTPVFNDNGQVTMIEGLARDRTHERAAAVNLAEAKDAAEAASQAKTMFLSNMSHELRTPLNGVLGYVQLLLSGPDVSSQQYDQLLSIEACGQHLLTLINDILDLTKIDTGEMELNHEPVNVVMLVESVEQILYQRAESRGLAFELVVQDDVPAMVMGDETKLRQILINLVGNAVKFTDEGQVSLNVCVDEGSLVFAVQDTGIGIPKDELKTIFDPFRQGRHSIGGTGLGLSISRRLAMAMKGSLEVESTEGKGSLFTFTTPMEILEGGLRETAQSGMISSSCRLQDGQDVHVLVVDDTATNRDILEHMLVQSGFRVTTAASGREAVRLASSETFDLVLMDLRMQGMSGFRTTRMLAARLKEQCPPVIAVSAGVYPSLPQTIVRWGLADFLGKPFRSQDLFRVIRRHLALLWDDTEKHGDIMDNSLLGLPAKQAAELHNALADALELGDLDAIREVANGFMGEKDELLSLWAARIIECCDALAMEELERIVAELAS